MRRLAAALGLALLVVVGGAVPAGAHAVLEGSEPAAGVTLDGPPEAVVLRFSEAVDLPDRAVRVHESSGDVVPGVVAEHARGDRSVVTAALTPLPEGAYVVTWRVSSDDGHPVRGAFTFRIGEGGPAEEELESLASRLLSAEGGSPVAGALVAADRWLLYTSLVLLVGGAAALVTVWPRLRGSVRTARLVRVGWGGALGTTLVGIALQGPYARALPLADALDPSVWADVVDTRYGRVAVARIVLLVVALPLLGFLLVPGRPVEEYPLPRWWPFLAGAVGAALVLTPGLAGHAGTGDAAALTAVADGVHVGAVCLWLGGLAVLAVALARPERAGDPRAPLARFSAMATAAVVALVLSGAVQAWRRLEGPGDLLDTDYGRVLLAKLVVFAVLLLVAARSRRAVRDVGTAPGVLATVGAGGTRAPVPPGPGPAPGPPGDQVRPAGRGLVARLVAVELLLAAAVLGASAVLAGTEPSGASAAGPYATIVEGDPLWFDVLVTPARAGRNDVHVTALAPGGGLTDVLDMRVTMSLPARDVAPIEVPLRRLGPGHYFSPGFDLPIAGTGSSRCASP
ncbi:MAG: copper resistance protein CopC [Acidimicrobiia bacterium]|nr:copper resistance protein CopC [Acidimicrobiia bacterium]